MRQADYADLDPRFGGPAREDRTDGFEIYENGGTTASFAYFTISALYHHDEKERGDNILLPMFDGFKRQDFLAARRTA